MVWIACEGDEVVSVCWLRFGVLVEIGMGVVLVLLVLVSW